MGLYPAKWCFVQLNLKILLTHVHKVCLSIIIFPIANTPLLACMYANLCLPHV